ncbi:MAG: oxygen-independent coproporphyrinogen III oxidase [candidate division Zixibacteria bacterium]|nr:oxygen-independent coproporphyrinogen III oxidase [candidate division Zixibacteria bacterium]NIT53225.1 oxygen-independent coproporphyrinogen III oxidase [candidate division Zixibacteria bacterium]NIW41459.1 oxygen-independent coproporphyrinogen III oxidase [candidate division Zixibacteria bacterium]NIX55137.1 oxygen-independent coproporphyrinogen III oxidase [candidate division Zixibacteria bacterium]
MADNKNLDKLLKKYDRPGPRYTSYPMVPVWKSDFGHDQYVQALKNSSQKPDEPLSLYLHIPFCRKRCWFCGCNTTTLKKEGTHDAYLDIVDKELNLAVDLLSKRRRVSQFHWGGGTPSCLSNESTLKAFKIFADRFEIANKAEVSIELDPRVTDEERIQLLKSLGFNRLSFGVQDFNADIQTAIGRNQDEKKTVELYRYCRDEDFEGINFDLIYGLPRQTLDLFKDTVKKTIDLRPDRIALYNFAYLPDSKPHQRLIRPEELPSPSEKIQLFLTAREMFLESGYKLIGMDHFVLTDDELAISQSEGRLRRNFMGYTVKASEDWLGFGMSSISYVDNSFAQNLSTLDQYQKTIEAGRFAVCRGMKLSEDDIIRQYLIADLMCNFKIDKVELERKFNITFDEYFKDTLEALQVFQDDGLLTKEADAYILTDMGKIFIRNIAMAFDSYLKGSDLKVQFSRTV